jgi:hypothetical protein
LYVYSSPVLTLQVWKCICIYIYIYRYTYSKARTAITGQPEQNIQNWTGRTGGNKTPRKAPPGQTASKIQPGPTRKERTIKKGHSDQNS